MGAKILIPRATRASRSVYDAATMYRMDWTDDRLQERFDSIDRRFDEVDRRFDGVDRRIDELDRRFDKVDDRLDRLDSKFDSFNRTMMLTGGGIIAALIGVIATQI